eukprot:3199932-Pyramimonas_sp.AAC.1
MAELRDQVETCTARQLSGLAAQTATLRQEFQLQRSERRPKQELIETPDRVAEDRSLTARVQHQVDQME